MTEVKKQRILNGYTQEYVADRIGLTQVRYSHKETGRVKFSLDEAIRLAKIYELTVEELFQDLVH